MQTVIETPDYLADAKRAGLSEAECDAIAQFVAIHPDAGDKIPGTGGARKLRFAGRSKGKSGGYRVITFFSGPDIPVFLLNVFAKGEKVDLTPAERRQLADVLKSMVEVYRAGVKRHVKGRSTHH
ncbi:MAG: addiction module toxin RelE [Dongiaceae bacterium]